jgi:hypothetical protein
LSQLHADLLLAIWMKPNNLLSDKYVAISNIAGYCAKALVQLNGDNFLFYNKSLGDLNVEKFTHKHPRSVDGVNDVWHAYPHSSRNLHDIGIARKLDWRLYKWLF